MDRVVAAEITPRFLRREDENRGEQLAERREDLMHGHLRRATPRRIDRVAIHPVLCDIDIEAAQIDGAELVKSVVDLVKFVSRVGRATLFDDLLKTIENPAIDERQIRAAGVSAPGYRIIREIA